MPIRRATIEDAMAIAVVHFLSWKAAYKDIVPDHLLAESELAKRISQWQVRLGDPASKARVYVYQHDMRDDLLGFVSLGQSREPDAEKQKLGEIYSLYLLIDYWGMGYGKALCQQAIHDLREQGYQECRLWVLSQNQDARTFYEKLGFTEGTTQKFELGGAQLNKTQYRQKL